MTSETRIIPFVAAKDALLIIIDMQEKLIPAMSEQAKIIANTNRLLALANTFHLPVVVTEQEKLGGTIAEIRERIGEFEPISKICFNCFFCEPFGAKVREAQRKTLIIAGVEAHICVLQTALWAVNTGFHVHVVADAVSSRAPENAALAIERMRTAGATITSTEMIIYELLEKGGTPEFKAMLPHVK